MKHNDSTSLKYNLKFNRIQYPDVTIAIGMNVLLITSSGNQKYVFFQTTDFQDNLIQGYRSLIADIQMRTQKSREDMDTLVSQIKLLMKNEADKAINYMTVYLEQISLYFQVSIHDITLIKIFVHKISTQICKNILFTPKYTNNACLQKSQIDCPKLTYHYLYLFHWFSFKFRIAMELYFVFISLFF